MWRSPSPDLSERIARFLKVMLAMWDLCLHRDSTDSLDDNYIFLQCFFLQIHSEHGIIAPAFVTALAEEEQKVLYCSGTFEINNLVVELRTKVHCSASKQWKNKFVLGSVA